MNSILTTRFLFAHFPLKFIVLFLFLNVNNVFFVLKLEVGNNTVIRQACSSNALCILGFFYPGLPAAIDYLRMHICVLSRDYVVVFLCKKNCDRLCSFVT